MPTTRLLMLSLTAVILCGTPAARAGLCNWILTKEVCDRPSKWDLIEALQKWERDHGITEESKERERQLRAKAEAEQAQRERAWEARCKPTPQVGPDGLTRYVYAHPDCAGKILN